MRPAAVMLVAESGELLPLIGVQERKDLGMNLRMQEITNPAEYDRVWNTVVATSKGYANYPTKTSRKIPLGWLRPA